MNEEEEEEEPALKKTKLSDPDPEKNEEEEEEEPALKKTKLSDPDPEKIEEEEEEEPALKKTNLSDPEKESAPFYDWPSSSEEPEGEEFIHESMISARNLDLTVSVADIQNFFATNANIGEPPEVALKPREDEKGVVVAMGAVIRFNSLEEAQAAVGLKGMDLLGRPVMLQHYPNGVRTVCVTGFDPQKSEDDLWDQLAVKFESFGAIERWFFPRSTSTNSYLGFAYLYLSGTGHYENDQLFKAALKELDKTMGGFQIRISHVQLKTWVNELITGGKFSTLIKRIEALQNGFEEHRQRDKVLETDREVTFSWRNTRPDLFFDYEQEENECWAIVLSRGEYALRRLADSASTSPPLPVQTIVDGVPRRCLISEAGIDKMKNAWPSLSAHLKEMKLHHRPKTDKNEDYEEFLTNLIHLAKKVPVLVMINCIPEFLEWDGEGIYCPTLIAQCRMAMEKDPGHGLILAGVGIENGNKFMEFQESYGDWFGEGGFIKLIYSNHLIKQVIELTV